jgi:DNA-binding Xre family transcriptional regulator
MITPESIDFSVLPSLCLTRRSELPEVPAIYFAINSLDQIQYIGRSQNLRQRWLSHHRQFQLQAIDSVRIAWLRCDDVSLLAEIEAALIEWFEPPLNGSIVCAAVTVPGVRRMYCQLAVLMAQKDQRLSQRRLAAELGLSITTINKFYNGRPLTARIDPDTVEKICNYFGCEISDLFVLHDSVED